MANTDVEVTIEETMRLISHMDTAVQSKLDERATRGKVIVVPRKSSTASGDSGLSYERSPSDNASPDAKEDKTKKAAPGGVSAVLQQLEQLIVSDEWIRQDPHNAITPASFPAGMTSRRSFCFKPPTNENGPRLSELGRALVTCSSLKAYINLLGAQHRQSIAAWLYGTTSQTLCSLLRFPSGNLHCSQADSQLGNLLKCGIGYAVRVALRDRYGTERLTHGFKTFVEMGAPVVYVSPAVHVELSMYLADEFAISDVVLLPKAGGPLSDVEGRIDMVAFEKQLDEDIAAGKIPLMVIAVAGSPLMGHNDMISRLLELRKTRNGFWIHIIGTAIAALALKEPNKTLLDVLPQVDSLTCPLGTWLGIAAAPVVTLYRNVEGHKPSYREKLDALHWWVASQHLSPAKMTTLIENAFFLSKAMLKGLSTFKEIEIIGVENPAEFANRVYKGVYSPLNVIIFKYKNDELDQCCKVEEEGKTEGALKHTNRMLADEYAESLNCWLGQGLLNDNRHMGLQMIAIRGSTGCTAFRFCALETAALCTTRVEHIQTFVTKLEMSLGIIESTVAARKQLVQLAEQYPSLGVYPMMKWAGVAAVCYIPSIAKETKPAEWSDKQRQQVSHLNLELVHSLRSVDTAFSSGDCELYGVSCVKFGMLSNEKDLSDLVRLVAERGEQIEHSQQYMDSLAEMIRQGIEAANEDIKKENDARIMQEGVLRQIPMMSSLVNWFSPLAKDSQNVKGRCFDLKTGEIHSSEQYYKGHKVSDSNGPSEGTHQSVTTSETQKNDESEPKSDPEPESKPKLSPSSEQKEEKPSDDSVSEASDGVASQGESSA